ncbi:DUF475 domain-containing protein [Nakamurella deserti]|uniref:DUF475 domain-containing protein n=1 Tax=Nakamurella deserti TaxID=2164074 RepID=UPI000DBEA260|nr:DUF475 domain-containing protein [Nakamurella deserti]
MLKIFGWSYGVTVVSLVIAVLYGGWTALFLCVILGILEVSLSFDNAVVNATILQRMSDFWQKIFLTVGIVIAVFGMRLVFPLLIVGITADLGPIEAIQLAMEQRPAEDPTSYAALLTAAHPQIAAFGGMFLLMLFLDYIFEDRDIKWLTWLERPLARIGKLDQLSVIVAVVALVLSAEFLAEDPGIVLLSGMLGLITYLAVNGLGELFHVPEEVEPDDETGDSPVADPAGAAAKPARGQNKIVKATGKAAFFLFLYLEVLDASFSFDGVIGAFAITSDPIIIALGLGLIGAMYVRSLTIFFVRKGTLQDYVYLEHGAHWAIGALAAILMISIGVHINEIVTGLLGVAFIGAAFISSLRRNKRIAREDTETPLQTAAH